MSDKSLKIVSTQIGRPLPVAEAQAARGVQERLQLSIQVDNPTDKPLHVWSTRRAYDYNSATHVLTLYLTEHTPPLPPGIEMISDHPRDPTLVVVNAKSRGTLEVPVPTSIRRRVPGTGLGMSFVEEPISQIDKIELHVQYATAPLQQLPKTNPAEHRKRLQAHGQVVKATIIPTERKER
jgi:hypothetical protein